MKTVAKSTKLANVAYDIRGPVLDKARQMEDEGHRIIKLKEGAPAGGEAYRPGEAGVALDEALSLKSLEVVVDGRWCGEANEVCDLTHRGGRP